MIIDVVKVMAPATVAFFLGIALTPLVTHYLYTYKAWKKKPGKLGGYGGGETPLFNELHKEKEVGTPRMGGIVMWASVLLTVVSFWAVGYFFPSEATQKLDFLSRDQTWIPLLTLLIGALVGLADDIMEVRGSGKHFAGGLPLRNRLLIVGFLATFVGWWFFEKLDVTSVGLLFDGELQVGWLIIPFFVLVSLALYASGVIDGIDGLSGGVFASVFAAYAVIAFAQEQINLAAFCATVVGGLLAFLWFNVPPARFYLSETGSMALTITIAVIAFMTDTLGGGKGVFVLPIIGALLVVTVVSVVLQVLSKKLRGKKIFLIAPLHHHFEAAGWPGYKVTMRYWVLSVMFALLGVIIALVS